MIDSSRRYSAKMIMLSDPRSAFESSFMFSYEDAGTTRVLRVLFCPRSGFLQPGEKNLWARLTSKSQGLQRVAGTTVVTRVGVTIRP
jgi:hypothetical protein